MTIGDGVTVIGDYAFSWCESLAGVTMGNGVKGIGDYAFYGCTSLATVTIPASVESIGGGAFYNCRSLKTVTYGGTEEQWEQIAGIGGCGLSGKEITFAGNKE